jgi:6-phosphogluconolactonase
LVEQNIRLTVPTEAVKLAQAGAAAFSFANGRIVQEEAHMSEEHLLGKTALATIIALFLAVLAGCGTSTYSNSSGNTTGGGSPPVSYTEFLYVGDNAGVIHAFGVDSSSGGLTPVGSFSVTNAAGASDVRLAADPSGTAVYATSAGTGGPNVVALTVNAASGALTAVAVNQTLPVPAGKIAVDPKGKNAYVIPDPGANTAELFGFSIDPTTHGLTALANQPIVLPGIPNDVTVDPSGGFVYITFQGTPGHEISGFSRVPNTGLLTTLGPPFANTGGDSPQGIRVTPNGDFVVVANLATSNVSVLSLTIGSGVLNNVASSPFATGNSPIPVAIDPSGNVVLVGNTGGDSLSAYTIGAGGVLNPVSGTPVPLGSISQPQSVAVDPLDKFVYISTIPSQVSGFTLNPSTGALTPITGSPFSIGVGTPPRDVIVVKP